MKTTTICPERGFSLVELMIALALGLFLTGVAITIVINNRQTFRTAENQARMQENARAAFEMMARDLRGAGGNPCAALHYHGFVGMEEEAVDLIARWILKPGAD